MTSIIKPKKNLCSNKLKDANFHLAKLVRKDYKLFATVASEEVHDKKKYDFDNLMDALLWVKEVGSAIHQPQGVQLDLSHGTHFWSDDDVLGAGESHAITYLRGNKLTINGLDKANTNIVFNNKLHNVTFQDCDIELKNATIEIYARHSIKHVVLKAKRSSLRVSTCNLQDVSLWGQDNSTVLLDDDVSFNTQYTNHKVAIELFSSSFLKANGTDFGGVDFKVSAEDNSEIYLHHCFNMNGLVLSAPLNTRSTDLSIIYDHIATGLHRTDLAWKGAPADGLITNTSGNDVTIPGATQTLAGLFSAMDKKKLDSLSKGFNGNLYQLLFKSVLDKDRTKTTPAVGEPLWVTDTTKLYMGDGKTPGGVDLIDFHAKKYIPIIEKGKANGVATLGANGKVPPSQMPLLAITNTFITTSETDMLQLTAQTGDLTIRTDIGETFILDGDPKDINSWYRMLFSAGVAALDDLNDVIISNPLISGQMLIYDGLHWRNEDFAYKTGSLWNPAHSYVPGDIVSWHGDMYVATHASLGDMPPSANWKKQVVQEFGGRQYDATVPYVLGDIVAFKEKLYIARKNTLGHEPDLTPGDWKEFKSSGTGLTDPGTF